MAADTEPNDCSPSTTTAWKWAKIPKRPQGPGNDAPKASVRRLAPSDRRDPQHLTVVYRGGPECWYEVHARGRVWRRPGHVALHDLMSEIYAGTGGKPPPKRSR